MLEATNEQLPVPHVLVYRYFTRDFSMVFLTLILIF